MQNEHQKTLGCFFELLGYNFKHLIYFGNLVLMYNLVEFYAKYIDYTR